MSTSADPLAAAVIAELGSAGFTLATAESLTAGLIGARLTSVPGASEVYLGGAITYATHLKSVLAGVDEALVARHGVISAEVAAAMAAGIRTATGADWALAVTGVAGPAGQDGHLPGEVWIGLAGPGGLGGATRSDFAGGRQEVREQTVTAALTGLLSALRAAAQSS